MKITKFISLAFTTSTTTANVSIPFSVKKMTVKSAAYKGGAQVKKQVVILTNMGEMSETPLCILTQHDDIQQSRYCNTEIKFMNPIAIQGSYTFDMKELDYVTGATISGTDYVGLIMEFDSEDEI